MKKISIFVLFLILFVQNIYALNVELISPVDNAIYVDSNTVVFKCKATGNDLRFIELHNNINGWSKKAEVTNPQNNTDILFSIKNISNGNYLWNCKAIDGIEGIKFSSSNKSFSVNIAPNNQPNYNGGLTTQSWNINTQKNNVFDLDNFFSDPDSDTLTYSVSGNANINVNIDQNNVVSLSQPNNWFGTERVYFTASDGDLSASSNYINLTVIKIETQNTSNTQPRIEIKIPDQNKSTETEPWILDLISYAKDTEDNENKLNWSVDGVNVDLLKSEIDNINKKIKFTSLGKTGTDTITLIVTDTGGLTTSQSIKINLYKTDNEKKLEEILESKDELKESTSKLEIKSQSPTDKEITVNTNKIMIFTIETNIKGDKEWYLDDKFTGETEGYYSFNSLEKGIHNLTVYITDLDKKISTSWMITVKEESQNISIINTKIEPICGNKIIEENENCRNCESDVKCLSNEICENSLCIEKRGFLDITGYLIKINKEPKEILKYSSITILSMFVISVIAIRRRNKMKYFHLKELNKKEGLIKRIQKRLREKELKRLQKKQNYLNNLNIETKRNEEIATLAPSLILISNFIKESLESGHKKSDIKKALKTKGWSRFQIWRAFRKIQQDLKTH